MGKRTVPFPHWPSWTTARFWSFIRSALRAAYNKYPPKFEALKKARKRNQGEIDSKRVTWAYQCASCKHWFQQKEVEADHIKGAGTLRDYSDLAPFVERLFCSVDDFQILCKPCHRKKTKEERSK